MTMLMMSRCLLRASISRSPAAAAASAGSLRTCYSTSIPEMPSCDFKPTEYKSLPFDKAMRIRKDNLTPALLTYYKNPVMINQGYMQWLWDCDGRRYLDLFGGIVTVSVGHCHPKVNEALVEQSKLLWHTTCIYLQPKIHEYAEKLARTLPGNLKVAYFVNSGSEANDLAMLMARLYTGNFNLLSFRNAYHGASTSLMGLTAHGPWLYNSPTGFGIHNVVNPDVYRGPWGGAHCRDSPVQTTRTCGCTPGHCEAADHYFEQLQDTLRHSCPKGKVAGFFAEAIQGVGGTVQYPKGYLKRAFEIVREYGGLCISDEVQTGFGRTGDHYWGFESHDVVPDIVTMAKGIGNGFPLAAVVTTPEIAKTMATAIHFNTYGGNPLSCAVGSAVLDVIEDEKLQENSKVIGTYFLEELAKLRDEFDVVGDVRGKGLMIGLELVKDKEKKTPLPAEDVRIIWEGMKDMGVLAGKGGLYGSVLRIKPPMCITKADAEFAIAVARQALLNYKNGTQ